ncbi:hypothetical protein OF83DRAFT_1170801 [Amylostereum chailletii]|nr:hypothetical protein OF83DRAFT_1170801 [Amylostereum chailletii]
MSQDTKLTDPVTVRDFGPPFADEDADIILRSLDNVDFRAHRLLLSKASPIFKDIFSLPSSPPSGSFSALFHAETSDDTKDGLPVVTMAEDQHILETLLRFCYPAHFIPLSKSTIKHALHAYRKFHMDHVVHSARVSLLSLLESNQNSHAEFVYAVAWQFEMKDVVTRAARLLVTNKSPLLTGPCIQEFDEIPGSALHKLLGYERTCAQPPICDLSWIERHHVEMFIEVWPPGDDVSKNERCGCRTMSLDSLPPSMASIPGKSKLKTGRDLTAWFFLYVQAALKQLKELHDVTSVMHESLMETSIASASKCPICRHRATFALKTFGETWFKVITDRIASIEMDTPF